MRVHCSLTISWSGTFLAEYQKHMLSLLDIFLVTNYPKMEVLNDLASRATNRISIGIKNG